MMICEICGKEIRGKVTEVYIDGARLKVCPTCRKFGTKAEPKKKKGKPHPKVRSKKQYSRRRKDDLKIVPDYSERIKNAREKRNISQKKLASKINEKESVIHRLETKSMTPSNKLAKKLEKALEIKLRDKISEVDLQKYAKNSKGLTIGDVIKIKKKE
ncbi:MAG: multiprotein bridging factor aMBF1 [Euryarchaeota archaeon]|nr:multiprotein bridging factor aMBF1 [Euryarchaeota archaeon]